jgi:hypothetical protein
LNRKSVILGECPGLCPGPPFIIKEKKMELTNNQVEAIRESLQKLAALGGVVSFICETGGPTYDALCGWQLLLWGIKDEILKIIDPEIAKEETA